MRNLLITTGRSITKIIDFFYPPFRKYMPLQLFRYGATGVSILAFDTFLYYLVYHYVLQKQMLYLGFVTVSSHIATLLIIFPVTLMSGFLLQKYVTFTASEMRGRVQLIRYLMVVLTNLLINYFGLKLFVDVLHFFATPSKMMINIISVVFSYFSQKKFTFRH